MKTLVTVLTYCIDEEILTSLNCKKIANNVYMTKKQCFDVQSYLYGNCGFSMYEVIVTKLDKFTIETYKNL